jgi:hypothetical protein
MNQHTKRHQAVSELDELKQAVLKYIAECDNPVPDYGYRRTLRNYLRTLTGAPKEPVPRSFDRTTRKPCP